eukprot:1698315-Prymnesium_polylepis.1
MVPPLDCTEDMLSAIRREAPVGDKLRRDACNLQSFLCCDEACPIDSHCILAEGTLCGLELGACRQHQFLSTRDASVEPSHVLRQHVGKEVM